MSYTEKDYQETIKKLDQDARIKFNGYRYDPNQCLMCHKQIDSKEPFIEWMVDQQKYGRKHLECNGGVECVKCGRIMGGAEHAAQLISPFQDSDGDGEYTTRFWLCWSCYDLVHHFATAKIGISNCS